MKILIADDDLISRRVVERALKDGGYDYLVAVDGDEAWRHLQQGGVKVAILDWIMPGLEGPEICRRLRAQDSATPIYVILLTVRRDKAHAVEGLQAGANDYVALACYRQRADDLYKALNPNNPQACNNGVLNISETGGFDISVEKIYDGT